MEIEIRHDGLKKYRHIRGTNEYVVKQKAAVQEAAWAEMWEKQKAIQAKKDKRERAAQEKQEKKELAAERTKEAEEGIDALRNTLKHTLGINDAIKWESLKDFSKFPKKVPNKPIKLEIPPYPQGDDPKYTPKIGIFDYIFFWVQIKKNKEADMRFYRDIAEWEKQKKEIPLINERNKKQYIEEIQKLRAEYAIFKKNQIERNEAVDKREKEYRNKNPEAIADYCDMVLSNSEYPDYFPQEFQLEYNPQTKILIVDYSMPAIEGIPKIKEVKCTAPH